MKSLRNSKVLVITLILSLVVSVFVGCTSEDNGKKEGNDTQGDTIEIAGSTSVQPVAEMLAEAFMQKHEGVKVNVQGIGSSAGVKAANNGTADVGTSSRNLKTSEKDLGLTEHVIAYDGIAVVVHPSNGVKNLTTEQVTRIYKGEITNWKEVGGKDSEIIVVSREAGSGTRGAFEDIMDLKEKINDKKVSAVTKDAIIAEGNGTVRQNVAQKENAIGYLSLSYLNESVNTVLIDEVEPTVENILEGKYPVSRPFLMLTKGEVKPIVKEFLDFIFSAEGQEIVAEKNIPVK